jgi:hypothetical protein
LPIAEHALRAIDIVYICYVPWGSLVLRVLVFVCRPRPRHRLRREIIPQTSQPSKRRPKQIQPFRGFEYQIRLTLRTACAIAGYCGGLWLLTATGLSTRHTGPSALQTQHPLSRASGARTHTYDASNIITGSISQEGGVQQLITRVMYHDVMCQLPKRLERITVPEEAPSR